MNKYKKNSSENSKLLEYKIFRNYFKDILYTYRPTNAHKQMRNNKFIFYKMVHGYFVTHLNKFSKTAAFRCLSLVLCSQHSTSSWASLL